MAENPTPERRWPTRTTPGPTRQVVVTLPIPLIDAVAQAADANFETAPNYIRRVLVAHLRAEGKLP